MIETPQHANLALNCFVARPVTAISDKPKLFNDDRLLSAKVGCFISESSTLVVVAQLLVNLIAVEGKVWVVAHQGRLLQQLGFILHQIKVAIAPLFP